jgi:hypothetical protein
MDTLTRSRPLIALAGLILVLSAPVQAQQATKIVAPDGEGGDRFGYSVSLDGEVAIVGAYTADTFRGAAYAFRQVGEEWVEEAKLTPSLGGEFFGRSVSVSGAVALVGAPSALTDGVATGAAYVFRWDGSQWVEEAVLMASDGATGDAFGQSVSISGDVAIVAAVFDDDNGTDSGSAYIFRRDGEEWVEEAKLTAPDGGVEEWFGYGVAVSGDVAVVPNADPYDPGTYVYRWNGGAWVEASRLPYSGYVLAVSVSEDVIVTGTPTTNTWSGQATVFRWDGSSWVEEAVLFASDGAESDQFGRSVSVSGDVALIGAWQADAHGSNSGAAYVFRWDGAQWVEGAKLTATDGAGGDWFGQSVSVSGNTALVGAVLDDDNGTDSGSAYVYDLSAPVAGEETPVANLGPPSATLAPPYPNPSSASTSIGFRLSTASYVSVGIYDLLGRNVTEVFDGPATEGLHTVTFDASRLPAGVYVVRLEADGEVDHRRVVVTR